MSSSGCPAGSAVGDCCAAFLGAQNIELCVWKWLLLYHAARKRISRTSLLPPTPPDHPQCSDDMFLASVVAHLLGLTAFILLASERTD